jgi:hypothetical protein
MSLYGSLFIAPKEVEALKKLVSFLLALCFTCGTVVPTLAQQALPGEQPAMGAEQAAPKKKAKKSKKSKKSKRSTKNKKAVATPQ